MDSITVIESKYTCKIKESILPSRGRSSSFILNSIVSVSSEYRRHSHIAQANSDARSTPQEWKSVSIISMDWVVRTTSKARSYIALILPSIQQRLPESCS